MNPNQENHKYLFVLTSIKNKTNILKIRTMSHMLHNETRLCRILKPSHVETISHLSDTNRVEDEKNFL
jgi:hypothetical protein